MIALHRMLPLHRALMRFGLSAVVFAWLFVFLNGWLPPWDDFLAGALVRVSLLYGLAQTVCALVAPIAMRELGDGMRRGIVLGGCLAALALIVLAGASVGMFVGTSATTMTVFAVLAGTYAAVYRIPYAVEASSVSTHWQSLPFEILIALSPAVWVMVGMIAGQHAFAVMFLGAASVIVAGTVPLLFAHDDVYERFSWGYRETFAQLFMRENRALVRRHFARGVESVALLLVWPLAIFLLLARSFISVGVILSLSLLAVLTVRYVLGKIGVRSSLVRDTVRASGWLARMLAVTPAGIVIADVYARVSAPSGEAFAAAELGHYVDEYTALKEEAMSIGRIAMAIMAAFLFAMLSFDIAFVVLFAFVGLVVIAQTFSETPQELF